MDRFVLIMVAICLAACGAQDPTSGDVRVPSDGSPPDGSNVQVVEEVVVDKIPNFIDRLTDGEQGYFRHDRLRENQDGQMERRVFVEMIGLNDIEAADKAAGILESLGYAPGRRWSDDNGVRMAYESPEGNRVRVLVRSREAHSKLEREDATSSVYFNEAVGH